MSQFTPTPEQDHALLCYRTGQDMLIQALAGTGKTSTLEMLARYAPQRGGMYLAFNKGIQTDAQRRFAGTNVQPLTMHALALRNVPGFFRDRLGGRRFVHWGQIAKAVSIDSGYVFSVTDGSSVDSIRRETLVNSVKDTVDAFMRSADSVITTDHVRLPKALIAKPEALDSLRAVVLEKANSLWSDYTTPDGSLPMNHQAYVKFWQLSGPVLNLDFLMVDEAQDLDPLMIDVVMNQQCQRVIVGDQNQAIYGWRGAVDAMDSFPSAWQSQLTQSFRFGPRVAEEAQKWLSLLDSPLEISGNPAKHSTVTSGERSPDAVICRTNAGAIVEIVNALERDRLVAIAGGKSFDLSKMAKGASDLQRTGKSSYQDFQIFDGWDSLVEFSETDGGRELEAFVGIVNKFGTDKIVEALDRCVPVGSHDLMVSTAHTAKGLEWGKVSIAQDFMRPKLIEGVEGGEPDKHVLRAEEARLSYVTVTRAMDRLGTGSLGWIDNAPSRLELI